VFFLLSLLLGARSREHHEERKALCSLRLGWRTLRFFDDREVDRLSLASNFYVGLLDEPLTISVNKPINAKY